MRNEARSSWRWPWRVGAVWLILLGLVMPAAAADMYRVVGVPVDVTAESAVAARQQAIEQGQRAGLATLLRRLTSPEDHSQLPAVTQLPIDRYVASYDIGDERMAPTRYLAKLNVNYVPGEVQTLLRGTGLPFVTRRSEPILIVPAERENGAVTVWVEASPWRSAWNTAVEQATITTLALPLGDLTDVAAAPPDSVAQGDMTALSALAGRYAAKVAVVAIADLRRDAAGKLNGIALTARRTDQWDQPLLETVIDVAADQDEAQALDLAAGRVVQAVENDWKLRNLVRSDRLSRLPVTVPLADLASWVQIRRELGGLPEVRSLQVDSFGRDRAMLTIGYVGDLNRLTEAVERLGLSLTEENDGWHLRRAGSPPGSPAPF